VGGLELRNVVANYPFEKSCRFAAIRPNFAHGDHSRLSCSAGDTQLGLGYAGIYTDVGHQRRRREGTIGRDLFRSEDEPPGGKASNTIAQFALDFPRKESVCGDHGRRA
jgi:hypothetical protein